MPITFRYSRRSDVTIHKHAIPGKKLHGEKKLKKTIQAHAVRLAIPGGKKYIGKKNVKKLYTHAPYASPFLENKKYIGKKKEKRLYTHTRRTLRHSWKKKVHWENKM